ncbi:MAG: ATP-binding protein [Ignavibacteriaceae bacterium]|jgi:predicted ATP-binding protein involved in virulence
MRIKKLKLVNFKRFDDLTIELGDNPQKIVAIVGPNGSGKSSIFDAFEEEQKKYKGANHSLGWEYFSKLAYAIGLTRSTKYDRSQSVQVWKSDNTNTFDKKSFYIRTAYRFTSRLFVDSIKSQPNIIEDVNRPSSTSALDHRLQENYERLLGSAFQEFFSDSSIKTGSQVRDELIGRINAVLQEVLEIQITNIGDVSSGKGQLFFKKDTSVDFPYENLSSGEKEVVDIIIDLIVKTPEYNDTVFCIDEPELHLNTSIQRKLIIEIDKLVPDNCQLWVATHSIGFLRALQTDLKEKSQILDFSEDYFNGAHTIRPIRATRTNWQRIFKTALEDLTGLVAPEEIIYCEGKPIPSFAGTEEGFDAIVYNEIFSEEFHNTLFVSAGGNDVEANSAVALRIITKAFSGVKLKLLKDRDELTETERTEFLTKNASNKMLERREIENYLFDKEVLKEFCKKNSKTFDEARYDKSVNDINLQDLKPVQQEIQICCGFNGSIYDFKYELAKVINKNMAVYASLKTIVF